MIYKIKKPTLFIAVLMLISCSTEEEISPSDLNATNLKAANKGIVHHASIGSNDACASLGEEPGCDKSFSLVANMKADGSVKGQ